MSIGKRALTHIVEDTFYGVVVAVVNILGYVQKRMIGITIIFTTSSYVVWVLLDVIGLMGSIV